MKELFVIFLWNMLKRSNAHKIYQNTKEKLHNGIQLKLSIFLLNKIAIIIGLK